MEPWSLAVPDWRERIRTGRSLLPDLPHLDRAQVHRAVAIFNKLRLPDVIGTPGAGGGGGRLVPRDRGRPARLVQSGCPGEDDPGDLSARAEEEFEDVVRRGADGDDAADERAAAGGVSAGAALHANGTQPGGVLSVKGSLDDAARARLKEAWAQYQSGLQNRFKTAVLDMDSTWTPLAMKGVDSEHLDTRRFQIEEICRDLKVFPQMVGYAVRRQDQLAAAALAHSEGHLHGHDASEALIGSCAINRHRRGNPGSRHPGRPFRRKSYIRGAGHVTSIFPRLRAPSVGRGR